MQIFISTVMFVLLSMSGRTAMASEPVLWRVTNWPPFYILEGPNKGKGIYDELITLLSEKMPEYDHRRIEMTTSRAQCEWEMGNNLCHPSVIPGDKSLHSVMSSIIPSHRVIVHESKAHLFEGDEIKIDELLANPNLVGGVIPGRYTETINAILEKHKGQKHLLNHPVYENQIKQLFDKRLDYIIEYSAVVNFMAIEAGIPNPTKAFKIYETRNEPYVTAVVGSTNNEWGKAMTEKINRILIEESRKPGFLESRLRWFDKSSRKDLEKVYMDLYFKDKQ